MYIMHMYVCIYIYIYTYMIIHVYEHVHILSYTVFLTVCLNPHFAWVDHLFLWAIKTNAMLNYHRVSIAIPPGTVSAAVPARSLPG